MESGGDEGTAEDRSWKEKGGPQGEGSAEAAVAKGLASVKHAAAPAGARESHVTAEEAERKEGSQEEGADAKGLNIENISAASDEANETRATATSEEGRGGGPEVTPPAEGLDSMMLLADPQGSIESPEVEVAWGPTVALGGPDERGRGRCREG